MNENNQNKDYTLEKFDIKRALAGETVCDIDGDEVTHIHRFDLPNTFYQTVGVIKGIIQKFTGIVKLYENREQLFIKIPKPKPREIWVNEYRGGLCNIHYNTKLEAEKEANSIYPKQVKFREVLDEK